MSISTTLPLPLPVTRLRRRAHNAKSSKDRHDTAWFAWEVSLRLAVAAQPPADRSGLARPGVGLWARAYRSPDQPLQDPPLLALYARLTEIGTDKRSERRSITPRELVDALPAYRNKVIGHGSARAPSFYEEAAAELLAGLDAAWTANVFLPPGARLVFVESVSLGALGEHLARIVELAGDAPSVLNPQGSLVPEGLRPQRLYLRLEAEWIPLHPWFVYIEESERLLCFNGLARRAEYLDYASGETLAGDALEQNFPRITEELRTFFDVSSSGAAGAPASAAGPGEGAVKDERRFGDYEVLGKLGQGGMGAVYLARQTSLERNVALKVLPQERAVDPVARARFQREIRALSRCEHPNVIKILASGEERGTLYYAMEYVEGADLGRIARALSSTHDLGKAVSSAFGSVLSERRELFQGVPDLPKGPAFALKGKDRHAQVARLFADAARGLAHLHDNGILHRDISPANLMVTWPEGRAVVMDLGLAAVENTTTLTKDKSQILGTLRYMAPERIARETGAVDARADVYSLGASLYELLTDRPFFEAETEAQLLEQVLRREPVPIAKVNAKVPRDLAIICEKACAKEPEQRYASAMALAEDLEAFLAGNPISARPPTVGYRLSKWAGKHKELAAAVAFGGVLLLGTGIYLLVSERKTQEIERKYDEVWVDNAHRKAHDEITELVQSQEKLWPATPDKLAALDQWLAKARVLIEGEPGKPYTGREAILAAKHRIELRGTALTQQEQVAARAAHEKFAEFERKQSRCAEQQYARDLRQAIKKERERPAPPAAWKVEPDWSKQPADASALNKMSWEQYVGPEPKQLDQARTGWWLARRALELATPELQWRVYNTLAWAHHRLGEDEEARRMGQLARDCCPAQDLTELDESQRKLSVRIEEANEDAELARVGAQIARAQHDIDLLAAEIDADTRYRFASSSDARDYSRYVALEKGFRRLSDPVTGLIAGKDREQGWGVELRRDLALGIEEQSRSGIEARRLWNEAVASIRDPGACPRYRGLTLTPQLGLLPLRRDPLSKLWEFTFLPSGDPPEIGPDGKLLLTEKTGLVMVLIPAGSFTMGSSDRAEDETYDPLTYEDEWPARPVALDAFFLSKFELTQSQWKHLMGVNPSRIRQGARFGEKEPGPWNPVEWVSWDQCSRFVERLGLVLPTEAQWEYAARAGTSEAWWTGDDLVSLQGAANILDRSCHDDSRLRDLTVQEEIEDGWVCHAPVGSYLPNAFGLHDVAGNVWEWCFDRYGPYGVTPEPKTGERLQDKGSATQHVIRGGGWFTIALEARSARRNFDAPDYKAPTLGLRPARAVDP